MCEIIEISILISLCCLGFRAITDKGMIFSFLRKPFDLAGEFNSFNTKYSNKYIVFLELIGKPLITCVTCMASVHTIIWYPIFNGNYDLNIIPSMLIVAFLNTLGWNYLNFFKK